MGPRRDERKLRPWSIDAALVRQIGETRRLGLRLCPGAARRFGLAKA